ncbi:MAG TPA: TolC family protein [Opitutaceae bacterium]|jgi:cobalt-zinc-cadmium efflux system outer membrane protein|nr:TolC family protein [Opitutaceae bacterium]
MKLLSHFISISILASTLPAAARANVAAERTVIAAGFIDRLLAEAQTRNLALAAAGARADAAAAGVDSVRVWEDPTFTLGYWKSTSQGFEATQQGDIIYGLDQKLPTFGRPELARHVAEAEAAKEQLNVGYETQKLRRDLTVALVELALADESIDLARQDLDWLETMVTAVDDRYKVGKSSQVEWLKIQTEHAKAANDLTTLKLERDHRQVEINRLLNRNLHAPWPVVALPDIADAVPYDDRLVGMALNFAPELKIMQQEITENEAASQVTKRQRLPEIGVGLQGRQYSGDGGFREGTVTVNFSLPWLNSKRYDSDFRRDQAKVRAAERDAADYTLTIGEEVHHLTVELDAARRQALLYRDEIIPLTEQTLASASTAWENNLGLFQDVLDARRMLVENRLALAQSVADQVRTLAELTLFTGIKDFPSYVASNAPTTTP